MPQGTYDAAAWTSAPHDRLAETDSAATLATAGTEVGLPVLDLTEDDAVAAAKLRAACTDTGFFYAANHGVSDELLARQFEQWATFFALPLEHKLALRAGLGNRGYHPLGLGSAKNPFGQADRKEGYNIYGFETEEEDIPFHGRNKWPPANLLPDFMATMLEYYDAMHAVANRVLQLLALALGLPRTWFDDKFDRSASNIRCVHYTEEENDPDRGIFGVGAHTDWGMLTVLATTEVGGLQILARGAWLDVPHRPGCFVVNLGDMTDRWTNGVFRSTLHRVVKRERRERYSSPFFLAPNWDAKIEVLPQCCSSERPARYEPTTCGEWLCRRRAAEYGGKPDALKTSPAHANTALTEPAAS